MKFEELKEVLGIGKAIAIYYSNSKRILPDGLNFAELADVYKESPRGSRLRKRVERIIMNRVKYESSFGKLFHAYKAFTDNHKLQKWLLKKMKGKVRDFDDWMDIYVEIPEKNSFKLDIEKKMLDAAENLEELFTLYYVIYEESPLAESVIEKIAKTEEPVGKWLEIFERIPNKQEFEKIREVFISKISKLIKK